MPVTTAFGPNPAIAFLSLKKDGLRQRRAAFDLMGRAWNGDPIISLSQELYTGIHCFEREPLKAFQDARGGKIDGLQTSGIPHALPWAIWDIDREPEKPSDGGEPTAEAYAAAAAAALADCEKLVRYLMATFSLDASDDVIRVNLSGSKGCHVRLWNPMFDPLDVDFQPDTFRRHKSFVMALADEAGVICDPKIYAVGNLIRLPNSRHPKTGRHAVPVAVGDLLAREHVAIIDPSATLWIDASQPTRTQRFLWPTGQFKESFKLAFAERWQAAGQVAEQAVIEFVEKKAAFKPEGGSYVSYRMPIDTQRILSGDAVVGESCGSRAVATFKIGTQCGERGLSLRGGWGLFREAVLGSGLPEPEAVKQFADGWRKGRTNLFEGASDEAF